MGNVIAFLVGLAVVLVPFLILRPILSGRVRRSAGRGVAVLVGLGLIVGVVLMTALGAAAFLGVGAALLVLLVMAGRVVRDAATQGKVGDPISAEEARRVLRGAGDEEAIDAMLAAQRERSNRSED